MCVGPRTPHCCIGIPMREAADRALLPPTPNPLLLYELFRVMLRCLPPVPVILTPSNAHTYRESKSCRRWTDHPAGVRGGRHHRL